MNSRTSLLARAARKADWVYRRATASLRSLPHFILIGAPRCGTTSLYQHLSAHPDILPAFGKELHYFDIHHSLGLSWYCANFPLDRNLRAGGITGEATPNYLVHPYVAERVRRTVPGAKFVVLLRNPVERTHSAWRLNYVRGRESLPFTEAIETEERRISNDLERFRRGEEFKGKDYLGYSYLAKSRYVEHLERWFDLFPAQQFLICKSEDIFEGDPKALLRIYSFLGIRFLEHDRFPRANASPQYLLDTRTRDQLARYFEPYNQRLYALLGTDYGWS